MRNALLTSILLVACASKDPAESSADKGLEQAEAAGKESSKESELPASVCEHPCAGPYATIAVFRDADGKVQRYRFDGDLEQCSHPPRIYFDAEGNEVMGIPMEPVVAGSPAEKALGEKQTAVVEGLTEAESLRCP